MVEATTMLTQETDEIEEVDAFPIGDLATRYGVSAQTIRNWERRGMIPPARRTDGGHRRYGPEHYRALDAILGGPVRMPVTC